MADSTTDNDLAPGLLRGILDRLPQATVVTCRADGIVHYINDRFTLETGYTAEQIVGCKTLDTLWVNKNNRKRYLQEFSEQGRVSHFRSPFRCASGEIRLFDVCSESLELDGQHWIISSSYNISEYRKSTDSLERAEERYRTFVQQSREGIVRYEFEEPVPVDLDIDTQVERLLRTGYVAECNNAFARIYGHRHADAMHGSPVRSVMRLNTQDPVDQTRAFILNGYRTDSFETQTTSEDGEVRWYLGDSLGIIENGMLTRVWGTRQDVTERLRLEERLRQSQKLEAIGHLAGGVAHDFNNLLTVIAGLADFIEQHTELDDDIREAAREICEANTRGAELTRQLLVFARRQVLKKTTLTLESIVLDMESMLRRLIGDHILLNTSLASHPSVILADRGQLQQLLMNLVLNARDAMADGGTITICSDLLLTDEGPVARLIVTDEGCGMDEDVKARVFEPFFTTKDHGQGSGLGLATVYGIVEQGGGTIVIDSKVGHGTSVTVGFPVNPGQLQEPVPTVQEPLPKNDLGGDEKILVAEDDDAIRRVVRHTLERRGYQVRLTADGDEAWRVLMSDEGPFDLLLTDVMMPVISGVELVERARKEFPDLAIVYMSGFAANKFETKPADLDQGEVMEKPFRPNELLRRIREVLDRSVNSASDD